MIWNNNAWGLGSFGCRRRLENPSRVVRCFVWLDSNRGHLGFPSRYRWQWTNRHQRNVAKNPRLKKSEVYVSSCFLFILGLFLRRKGVSHWSMEFWWWRVQRFDPGILSTGPKFNTLKRGHPQTKSHFSQCSVYLKGLVVSDFFVVEEILHLDATPPVDGDPWHLKAVVGYLLKAHFPQLPKFLSWLRATKLIPEAPTTNKQHHRWIMTGTAFLAQKTRWTSSE